MGMRDNQTQNAVIESTSLGFERGIMTFMIHLKFGNGGQGFGGYALCEFNKVVDERAGTAAGLQCIMEILKVLDVKNWESLPGTPCRAYGNAVGLERLGHLLKDKWVDVKEIFKD